MRRWKVLVSAPRALQEAERYKKELGKAGCEALVNCPVERWEEEELVPLVGDIDGIICGDDRITKRVLDAAPFLKVISKWGIGIDSIDLVEAKKRNIPVYNTPGAFNDPVADTVLGYMLLFARKLDQMAIDMRLNLWLRKPLLSLRECTLGIVGLGNIGIAVARRAAAFGMRIYSYTADPPRDKVLKELGIHIVTLEQLFSRSDFVSLHMDLRSNNHHIIDSKGLSLMKSTSIIINTARGALIDEEALIAALQEGRIAGAALDVFENEPLDPSSPLLRLENVYLAPHNSGSSSMAAEQVHQKCISNLLQGLSARRYG